LFLHELLAFTAQLDITYKAPTPVNEPITAEAWMASRDGRKLRLECTVQAGETVIASATALFIAVDPSIFLTARQ
jgi:acyl-CoA thioesterase FadM